MYNIIGGDGKEYGPVTEEQVKQWLAEGRASTETPIKRDGEADWKKVSDFPELSSAQPAPEAPSAPVSSLLSNSEVPDYQLDIGACLSRAWNLVIANWQTSILATLLVGLAMLALQFPSLLGGLFQGVAENSDGGGGAALLAVGGLFNLASGVLSMVFQGVLYGGLYYFFLKLVRGETTQISDAFSGFKRNFVQLILAGVVTSILVFLGILLCVIPGIYLGVSYAFVFPLVIDKQMGFWDAMELSRKTITKHWFWVFLFVIIISIIASLGMLACIIGLLFTVPIACAALMYAYEDIFGAQKQ